MFYYHVSCSEKQSTTDTRKPTCRLSKGEAWRVAKALLVVSEGVGLLDVSKGVGPLGRASRGESGAVGGRAAEAEAARLTYPAGGGALSESPA